MNKRIKCIVLLLALLLSACGSPDLPEDDGQEPPGAADAPAAEEEPPAEPEVTAEEALARTVREQYRAILGQADTYEYSQVEPSGVYRYALVPMQARHCVPALFVEQQSTMGIGYIRVFQYDPEGETVYQPAEVLMQGVGDAGGFRGSLSGAGDRNGVLVTSFFSGTGEGATQRITVERDALLTVTLWEGNIFEDTDWTTEEIGLTEIEWYGLEDTAPLDAWTPDPDFVPAEPAGEPAGEPGEEGALPTDGDRIVFRGTIDSYSYEETIRLQGCPDPNAGYTNPSDTYRMIVLDTPQNMTLESGSGEGGSYEGEVRLICVDYATLPKEYDGQHLVFSMDPNSASWPSDTGMPVGQPWAVDVRVLE